MGPCIACGGVDNRRSGQGLNACNHWESPPRRRTIGRWTRPVPAVNDALKARFARLEPLIDRALELEGAGRERFLALCAEIHPDLVADLRRALADDAQLPALGGLAEELTREHTTNRGGLRAGAWRLLEKI